MVTLFVVPVERSFRLVFRQLRESARELRKLLRPQAPLCVQLFRWTMSVQAIVQGCGVVYRFTGIGVHSRCELLFYALVVAEPCP